MKYALFAVLAGAMTGAACSAEEAPEPETKASSETAGETSSGFNFSTPAPSGQSGATSGGFNFSIPDDGAPPSGLNGTALGRVALPEDDGIAVETFESSISLDETE